MTLDYWRDVEAGTQANYGKTIESAGRRPVKGLLIPLEVVRRPHSSLASLSTV
jgi:hypothetical protein